MKKLSLFLILTVSLVLFSLGCEKSEQEKLEAKRTEQYITNMTDSKAIALITNGKKLVIDIFTGVNSSEEFTDEAGIVYNPMLEKYDSPEKIMEALKKYYTQDYAEKLTGQIPVTEINGRYMLPVGDMGTITESAKVHMVERVDLDENNINIKYKRNLESQESFLVGLERVEGFWRIKSEVKEIDKK